MATQGSVEAVGRAAEQAVRRSRGEAEAEVGAHMDRAEVVGHTEAVDRTEAVDHTGVVHHTGVVGRTEVVDRTEVVGHTEAGGHLGSAEAGDHLGSAEAVRHMGSVEAACMVVEAHCHHRTWVEAHQVCPAVLIVIM